MEKTNLLPHSPALIDDRLMSTREVMKLLRYNNAAAFYAFCREQNVPLIQINQRKILFPRNRLQDWLASRACGMGVAS